MLFVEKSNVGTIQTFEEVYKSFVNKVKDSLGTEGLRKIEEGQQLRRYWMKRKEEENEKAYFMD